MRRLSYLFCALSLTLAASRAHAACNAQDLARFVASAQAVDPNAVATGREMVKCPAQRDQAIFWHAFLIAQTGDVAGSQKLDDPNPGKTTGATRESLIARARAGQPRDLKAKIDDQEPGYANSPDALLVLARVATRKRDFATAREAYFSYLRLVPDNDEVETELLYTYIWEGNYGEAEARLNAASRYSLRPAMAAAVQRGQALVAKRQKEQPKSPLAAEKPLAGLYKLELGAHHIQGAYQRRTARASYEGPVDFSLSAHSFDVDALERYKARATEARFGARGTLGQSFFLKGHLGYFSPGDDHYVGDASFGVAILPDLITEIGATREPLALSLPLVQDDLDLMRDTIFYGLRYGRYVEVRLELQKERDYASHEYHSMVARVPIMSGESGGPAIAMRFPASVERYPNPSPNYATDPRTVTFGGGVELHRDYGSRWSLDFILDYGMARVTSRNPDTAPRTVGVLSSEADVAVPLDESWRLSAGFKYYRADEEEQVYTRNKLSGILLGLAYADPG